MAEQLVRIRVLGPRDLVDLVTEELRKVRSIRVMSVSPPYGNRRDDGVRRYIDVMADEAMLPRLEAMAAEISGLRNRDIGG